MKKHLIAIAVSAAVAAPAMAQVTVSGVLDTSYQSLKNNGTDEQNQSVVNSSLRSSSNLRISGTEDLGGGLKAHFLLEEGLTPDTAARGSATDGAFGRGAFIGISGGFGTVNVGTPNATFVSTMATYNTWGGNINQLAVGDGRTASSTVTSSVTLQSRPMNSIQYISPTFNGVSANIVMSSSAAAAESATPATKEHGKQTQFNLTGKVGALSFIVGAAEQKTAEAAITGVASVYTVSNGTVSGLFTGGTAASSGGTLAGGTSPTTGTNATTIHTAFTAAQAARTGKLRNQGLGLTYDLGVAQVTYSFIDGKSTRSDTTGDLYKFRSQGIYAQIPFGSYSFFVSHRDFENKTAGATGLDHTGNTVGVTYNLSKRTNVYAVYDRVKNDVNSQQITRGGTQASAGEDPSQIGIGLRHSF